MSSEESGFVVKIFLKLPVADCRNFPKPARPMFPNSKARSLHNKLSPGGQKVLRGSIDKRGVIDPGVFDAQNGEPAMPL